MTTHTEYPILVGIGDIREKDPFALTEHIRYLAKHHHDFESYRDKLEALVEGHRGETGSVWRIYEDFLTLLDLYEETLETGSFDVETVRKRVEAFDLHLNGEEPSPTLPEKPSPSAS
ncbi:hypothetical protein TSACC_22318 [Terrimicrobium sacchariphilum]|uniref:Uncharacterized protein n=1 Tax=Terrimicrobium sacchariphilum TaxID=690879 RepID=A0A146GAT0_TERSA|nr:hypothetical protein [Terrimicrobium sacchariphilum]GAT33897.1 hypothetical protein TSACC_22318 [Terrimicrobium sacchariphilum]